MSLYKKTYRIEATRLQHHDYTFAGPYFITICIKEKKYSFGEIVDDNMNLSDAGKIAEQCWSEIPNHFPSVSIAAFVVMPNHIHGIIILSSIDDNGRDAPWRVSSEEQGSRKFGPPQKNSIPLIINAYKSSVTRLCRESGIKDFAWQEQFYDHVIRGEHTFHKVRRYINGNVAQWMQDGLNLQNTQ